jgi:hypothetical protein
MVAHAYYSSYNGKHKIEKDHGPGQPGQKVRPYEQNNQSKTGWRHGSGGRVSA